MAGVSGSSGILTCDIRMVAVVELLAHDLKRDSVIPGLPLHNVFCNVNASSIASWVCLVAACWVQGRGRMRCVFAGRNSRSKRSR